MNLRIKNVFAFIVFYLLTTISAFSVDITSTLAGGNWSLGATWVGGVVPTAADNVTIVSGATVTIDQDVSIVDLFVNGNLVIGNDATSRSVTIAGNSTITVGGNFTVGAYDISHNILLQGDLINNGTLNFFNSASQTANAVFDGTLTVGGTTPPVFAKVIFNSGTITAAVSFDVRGAVVIENATTFDDGNLTHTVAGNWTENGTGQLVGNGTIEMQAALIQSITSPATFYNLTFNGGGIGVIGASINVSNDFLVDANTQVNCSQYNTFQGDFNVTNGSIYEATAGRATFNSANDQAITIGTSNVIFNELYFDNGTATNPKTISGDIVANAITYIYDDAVVNDGGNNHSLNGLRLDGTCNFSGTITAIGGTFYDDGDSDFTLGTADLIAEFLYVGSNDVMHVNGNVTVGKEDNTDYNYLVINDGSQLVGQAGNTLLIKDGKYLYIRGVSNFPTGFGTITFADGSYARYDGNIDQTINSSVTYWHLYLNNKIKTVTGDLDINGNLYLYSAVDFQMGGYNHTIAGSIVNTDDSYGNGSLTSTGTITLDAPDANQYIYDAGTGTYTFNNLILTNTAPTAARTKYFRNDIIVSGNFSATNLGGSDANGLYLDIDENTITGGNNFTLGANVWLLTSGVNSFQTTITSFSGTKLFDVNSTVRFDRTDNGSNQNIPGGVIYGNIELYGSNNKIPQSNLDINGNLSSAGYTPVFTDNSHQINIAGNWILSYTTTNLTGTNTVVFDGIDQEISQSNFSYVYFSNTGTKNIIGDLDILKNLTIQAGVIVETERSINIEGNWLEQTTGEFHQTGGITTFDGTTANQVVTANPNSYFNSFYIDKKAASKLVTLNSDIDINGTFNFVEDNASFDMNHHNIYVAGDLYFREGCSFSYNGGTAYFDGNEIAQLIRNYNGNIMVFGNAEFLGTAVKRLYGYTYKFEGNVTISNTTLDGQSWDIFVEGDWINNGIFKHSATLHFNGANNQNISQSSFHSVRFGGGNFVKTLSGDINLTGNLWIDDATLDVSVSSYNITLDDYWQNDSTGSFIAHEGTVTVTGEYNRIFTGATNTLYGASGQVITQGGVKDFYNLTINATNEDYWMFVYGNLVVKNNFEITKGRFYQSYDVSTYGRNDIYVGGNFINHGSIYNNNYGEKIELNPTAGNHIFDPGSSNNYGHIYFNGAAATSYTFESDLFLYDNRTITIDNGDLFINSHKIETKNSGGNIILNGGAVNVNQEAIISVGNGATFTNAGGILQLIG
ncbi:MAG: G8 domain-containing protein, partial [Bacteroidales bacterium]|nr:G8 domain-containing protein [Bacteroidales bacterium]